MPPSTRMQRNRQRAAERAILGKIEENSTKLSPLRQHSSQFKNELVQAMTSINKANKVENDIFDPTDGFDGLNADHVRSVIEDLETEIRRRVEAIHEERENAHNLLKQQGRLLMFQFPTEKKKMTVGEFYQRYGVDLKTMQLDSDNVLNTINGSGKRFKLQPTPLSSSSGRFETPGRIPTFSTKITTPSSVLRTAQKGEKTFSERGSPISDVEVGFMRATLGKKRTVDGDNENDVSINLDLHLGDGNYLAMCPENIEKLDDGMKSVALKQLQLLKANLANIESCFQKK